LEVQKGPVNLQISTPPPSSPVFQQKDRWIFLIYWLEIYGACNLGHRDLRMVIFRHTIFLRPSHKNFESILNLRGNYLWKKDKNGRFSDAYEISVRTSDTPTQWSFKVSFLLNYREWLAWKTIKHVHRQRGKVTYLC
jgi:hypothetical protein